MSSCDAQEAGDVEVVRWLAADTEPVPLVSRGGIRPDDSYSSFKATVSRILNTPNICAWCEYDAGTAIQSTDVATAIVDAAFDPAQGTVPSAALASSLLAHARPIPPAALGYLMSHAVMTWSQSVAWASSLVGGGTTVAEPLGVFPKRRMHHPNPFLPLQWDDDTGGGEQEVTDARNRTLESYRDARGRVRINVATMDDVRSHLRRAMSDKSEDARMTRVMTFYLLYFFPEAFHLGVRLPPFVPPPSPPPASGPTVSDSSSPSDSPCEWTFTLQAMHLEVRRLEWTRRSPTLKVHPGSLEALFRSLALSNAFPAARIVDRSSSRPRFRIFRPFLKAPAGPPGFFARAMQSFMPRASDQMQVSVFGFGEAGCWCTSFALAGDDVARLDIHLAKGRLPVGGVRDELARLRDHLLSRASEILGWSRDVGYLDVDSWARPSHNDGAFQRLVGANVTTVMRSVGSTPATDALHGALSASGMGAYFENVEKVGPTVVMHYRRTNKYARLTPAQQTVQLNSTIPPHVLAGLLTDRYGMGRADAQRVIDEEFGKREHTAMNPATFVIVKPMVNVGVTVTVRGMTDVNVARRVASLVSAATHMEAYAPASTPGDRLEQEFYDAGDDDDGEGVPDDLQAALAKYGEGATDDDTRGADGALDGDADREGAGGEDVPGRYLVSELHKADPKLFDTGNKPKRYSRICGHVALRQPVRVSPQDVERINRDYPGALTGALAAGSSAAALANNRYICPKVWCPKSRVALTTEQYEANGRRCPDPNIREEALVFDHPSYWKGRDRFPGFLDPKFHPEGLCMPCCFLKPGRKMGRCPAQKAGPTQKQPDEPKPGGDQTSNMRYIYGDNTLLPDGRFGFLPPELHRILNAGSGCATNAGTHLTNRASCVLRKGVPSGKDSLFTCLPVVLKLNVNGRSGFVDLLRRNLDTATFASLHRGALARAFAPPVLAAALGDPVSVNSFVEWFKALPAAHIKRFGLHDVKEAVASGAFGDSAAGGTVLTSAGMVMLRAAREYALFLAMQAYLDRVEATKTHHLLLELVNAAPAWLNPEGVYLVVLCRDGTSGEVGPTISCPTQSSSKSPEAAANVGFLVKHGDQYEAVCTVTGVRGGVSEAFSFDAQRTPGVRSLLSAVATACSASNEVAESSSTARAATVARALRLLDAPPVAQVVDYSLACVALMTDDGVYVPLPRHDAVILSMPDLGVMYIEDALHAIKDDASPQRERKVAALFERLAKTLQDPAFEVMRAVQHRSGGRALLLRMGRTTPLHVDEDTVREYMMHIRAFVNVPHDDRRVSVLAAADARDARSGGLHRRFLAAVQNDAMALRNLLSVADPRCALPWDIRHKYIAWSVGRSAAGASVAEAAEVADRILLGHRHKGRLGEDPDPDVLWIDDVDADADLNARLGAADDLEAVAPPPSSSCGKPREIEVHVARDIPPELVPSVAAALASQPSRQKNSLVSKASFRAKSFVQSNRSRPSPSSRRSGGADKVDMIGVPITIDVVVDVMLLANSILHRDAPIARAALAANFSPVSPRGLLESLFAMARLLDVPVAAHLPGMDTFKLKEGTGDMAVLVTIRGAGDADVILTRFRSGGKGTKMFGVLTSIARISQPGIRFVVPH